MSIFFKFDEDAWTSKSQEPLVDIEEIDELISPKVVPWISEKKIFRSISSSKCRGYLFTIQSI